MTQRKHPRHFGLMLLFTTVVFVAMLISSAFTALAVFLLVKTACFMSPVKPHPIPVL